jgi:hypothetical protein
MKTTHHEERETAPVQDSHSNAGKICYVRPVLAAEVRDEIEREADKDIHFSDDAVLYALHAADGSRIALMSDRAIAFAAAKQHEMLPVSLH